MNTDANNPDVPNDLQQPLVPPPVEQQQTPALEPVFARNPTTGRFGVGNNANPRGRPPGSKRVVLSNEVEKLCAEGGLTVGEAVQKVAARMFEKASKDGDVQAAKLLLDGLTHDAASERAQQAAALQGEAAVGPPVPTGRDLLSWARQFNDSLAVPLPGQRPEPAEFALRRQMLACATDRYEAVLDGIDDGDQADQAEPSRGETDAETDPGFDSAT